MVKVVKSGRESCMGDGTSVYNMYQVDDAGVWELVEMKETDIQNTHTHTHTHTHTYSTYNLAPSVFHQKKPSRGDRVRVSLRCCSGYLVIKSHAEA